MAASLLQPLRGRQAEPAPILQPLRGCGVLHGEQTPALQSRPALLLLRTKASFLKHNAAPLALTILNHKIYFHGKAPGTTRLMVAVMRFPVMVIALAGRIVREVSGKIGFHGGVYAAGGAGDELDTRFAESVPGALANAAADEKLRSGLLEHSSQGAVSAV